MIVNTRKPIRIKNKTKYFDPQTDRTFVQFMSPETYKFRQTKIRGYECRLYWQYKYCEDHDGQTYFYTLTYNDAHVPKYLGENCFDYEDLRDLLTGGFRKMLLRRYGTTFKYFISAELGDGKGSRGLHNNPHYHVLFFLENAHNDKYPYVKILPEQFRYLVKKYWQGFDENIDGFRDYREAKYGIAKEGDDIGLVRDFRAANYCAKYVCKDVRLRQLEKRVISSLRAKYSKEGSFDDELCYGFWRDVIYPMYNIPLNAKNTEWTYTDEELIYRLLGSDYQIYYYPDFLDESEGIAWIWVVPDLIKDKFLYSQYAAYKIEQTEDKVRLGLNEYRNRYTNKCRISQGVGDYALDFLTEDYMISIPSKKGFVTRALPMYLYRKLFTNVVKDKKGNPIRVLNELGIDYRVSRLQDTLKQKVKAAKANLDLIVSNPDLYDTIWKSDVNTDVNFDYDEFFRIYNYLLEDNNNDIILQKYAAYKTIYEDRYYRLLPEVSRDSEYFVHPPLDYEVDYRRFLKPSIGHVSYSDLRLDSFLDRHSEMWIPYFAHPDFLRYQRIFRVLDLCSDYFFVQEDAKRQREAEERAATKRFHDREKMKEFFAFFK